MEHKTYCIKPGYQARHEEAPHTALESGASYWHKSRIDLSKYYQYAVYQQAARIAARAAITRVADIGCGSGYKLMHQIAPVAPAVTGFDQPFIIEQCQKRYPEATWQSLDLDHETKSAATYDLIVCADVIEHLQDPDVLLRFIKTAAHPQTIILLSTPERDVLHGVENIAPTNRDHIREWNQAELTAYVEASGFRVTQVDLVATLKPHLSKHYFHFLRKNTGKLRHTMMLTLQLR